MITVAMIGAESTGKSVLARRIANALPLEYVPEWASFCYGMGLPVEELDCLKAQQELNRQGLERAKDHLRSGIVVDTHPLLARLYMSEKPVTMANVSALHDLLSAAPPFDVTFFIPISTWNPLVNNGARLHDGELRYRINRKLEATWSHQQLKKAFNSQWVVRLDQESVNLCELVAVHFVSQYLRKDVKVKYGV